MTTFVSEMARLLNRYSIDSECNTPDYILAEMVVEFIHRYRDSVENRGSDVTDTRVQGMLAVLKSTGMTRFRLAKLHLRIDGVIIQSTMYYDAVTHSLVISKDSKPLRSGISNCSYVENRLIPSTELIGTMDSLYPGFGWRTLPIRFE